MSGHTPGPWYASQATSKTAGPIDGYWLIRADNYVQVADLFGLTGTRDEDGDDEHISNEESRANARLIAAAPDLLAACEAAARWLDALNDPDERADDMTLAYLKLETERAVFPALRTAKKRG